MKNTSFPGIAVGPSGIPAQGATAQLRCSKSKMYGLQVSNPRNTLLLQMKNSVADPGTTLNPSGFPVQSSFLDGLSRERIGVDLDVGVS